MDENSRKTKIWMDVSFLLLQILFFLFSLFVQDLIEKGEALNCPSCQVLLLKKWGCDWVRCTYCRYSETPEIFPIFPTDVIFSYYTDKVPLQD